MIVKQIGKWTEYERVVLDDEGRVWCSKREYDTNWEFPVYKGWLPWERVEI